MSPGLARAGGFYVPEIGSRSVAMGGAMTAQADDTTTLFHNPAGMSALGGQRFLASGLIVFPRITHFRRPVTDPNSGATINFDPAENQNPIGAVPFLGASFRLRAAPKLSLGFSLAVPFGAALEYPDDGAQRFVVTKVDLRTIFVGPSAAYQVTDTFSVGASLHYVYGALVLEQRNAVQFITGDPEANPNPDPAVEGGNALEGSDPFSFTATLGVRWQSCCKRYALGASVLLPVTLELDGEIDAQNRDIADLRDASGNVVQAAGRRTDGMHTEIPLPLIVRVGAVVKPAPSWTIALDANWQRWSTFDRLLIEFENNHELLATPGANLYDVTLENGWKDTFSVRLGGAYLMPTAHPLELRAGVLFDQSPIDDRHYDVLTPDSDKLGLSAGLATRLWASRSSEIGLELGYMHLFMQERNVAPAGGQPGSDRTILNKPAPSFFHGVTRARFDLVSVSLALRL